MKGKDKCRILKQIRAEIARQNDINLVIEECTHKGECRGTCPRCEAEVRYLERELEKRRLLRKGVALAGISAGMTLALSGCAVVDTVASLLNPRPIELEGLVPAFTSEPVELDGDVAMPTSTPPFEDLEPLDNLTGLLVPTPTPEPEELDGEVSERWDAMSADPESELSEDASQTADEAEPDSPAAPVEATKDGE